MLTTFVFPQESVRSTAGHHGLLLVNASVERTVPFGMTKVASRYNVGEVQNLADVRLFQITASVAAPLSA